MHKSKSHVGATSRALEQEKGCATQTGADPSWSPDIATEVAEKADARWMLTGKILSAEPNLVVQAELSEVATGALISSTSITGRAGERIFDVVDRLTREIKGELALPEAALADVPNELRD